MSTGEEIKPRVIISLSAELDHDSNVVGNTGLIWQNYFGTWWLLIFGMDRPPYAFNLGAATLAL